MKLDEKFLSRITSLSEEELSDEDKRNLARILIVLLTIMITIIMSVSIVLVLAISELSLIYVIGLTILVILTGILNVYLLYRLTVIIEELLLVNKEHEIKNRELSILVNKLNEEVDILSGNSN